MIDVENEKVDVAVLGSTGYVGQELVGILKDHPAVDDIYAPSRKELDEFEDGDVVFLALPHGESARHAARFRDLGKWVIDLSGDLRFQTAEEYEKWYGQPHPAPDLLPVPYALMDDERRDKLGGQQVVSVPGCYPTATLLGMLPLLENGTFRESGPIAVDAISGISGRGKDADRSDIFNDSEGYNAAPYKAGREHRHVGEIEQFLNGRSIFFSPTVIPLERGMLVKTTAQSDGDYIDTPLVLDMLDAVYKGDPFIEVLPEGRLPDIKDTAYTDQCHIGAVAAGGMVQTVSSIDNLRKGAASQAVEAFNAMIMVRPDMGLTPKDGWL